MSLHQQIIKFIEQGRTPAVVEYFTKGMCYYYALILYNRFKEYDPIFLYDQIEGHFAIAIEDKIYDITGELEDCGQWTIFGDLAYQDPLLFARIVRDCIEKINRDY